MSFVIRLETLCSRKHRSVKDMLGRLVGSERRLLKYCLKQKHSERSWNFCYMYRWTKNTKENGITNKKWVPCFTSFWQTCRNSIFDALSVLPGFAEYFQSHVVHKMGFAVMLWEQHVHSGMGFFENYFWTYFSVWFFHIVRYVVKQTKKHNISIDSLFKKKKSMQICVHTHKWTHP